MYTLDRQQVEGVYMLRYVASIDFGLTSGGSGGQSEIITMYILVVWYTPEKAFAFLDRPVVTFEKMN